MSNYNTQGWDVVGAINQRTLNAGLSSLYDKGVLPRHFEQSISTEVFSGSLVMDIDRPVVNLGGATQGMAELTFKIARGVLVPKGAAQDTDLTGATVTASTVLDMVHLTTDGGHTVAKVYFNFKSQQTIFRVQLAGLPRASQALLNALLDYSFEQLRDGTFEVATVDMGPLGIPDYLVPRRAFFTLVTHLADPQLSELVIMMTTISTAPGNPAYSERLIPDGQEAVILLSNERLLANVIGNSLRNALPHAPFIWIPNRYFLLAPVDFNGYFLYGAWVTVEANAVRIRLSVAALNEFGGGINVYVDSDTRVTVRYDAATSSFVPESEVLPPSTRWEAEWWVWLLGIFLGGIIGPIITAILGNIASTQAAGISYTEIRTAFTDSLKPIKWPASELVTPTQVNLPEPLQLVARLNF